MPNRDEGGRSAMRALGVAAVAVAGVAFGLSPLAGRLDDVLLDVQWRILKRIDSRSAPDDIVIVGVDEASVRSIPEPPALWHVSLGRALARVAAGKPRAVAFDLPLPERSYDGIKPGLDRALFDGLAAAVEGSPFVAALHIDPRTRDARPIHKPYLALLGESRLGLNLIARDPDGVARRYSLTVPTEEGGFPTIEGRLCRSLKVACTEGLIHFSLGRPYVYLSLKNLLAMDDEVARRVFRDRIVLFGEAQSFSGRIDVPVNLAGWENESASSPGIVVRAQTLRTALAQAAPREASRPLAVVLVSLAALLFLMRDWRMAAVTGLLVVLVATVAAVTSLRNGMSLPLGAPFLTLALAIVAAGIAARRGSVKTA
jgi:adenylate cyclase